MQYGKVCFATLVAILSTVPAYAYLTRVENATEGDIIVTINLSNGGAPVEVGILKSGETSKLFDTGPLCFDSISATGMTHTITGMSTGNIKPWGSGWQCFQNIHFKCYEMKSGGKTTGIGFHYTTLAGHNK